MDGGNAIDAAIATTICIGAVNPQSAGIGGGFLMTLYDPVSRTARCLNAREVAPIAATENMFGGNAKISQKGFKKKIFKYFQFVSLIDYSQVDCRWPYRENWPVTGQLIKSTVDSIGLVW